MRRASPPTLQSRWRTPPPTRPSDELSESAVLAEGRMPQARRESGKTRECRAPTFQSDRKAVHPYNRVLVIAPPVATRARANHRAGRRRLIQLDKLSRRRGQSAFLPVIAKGALECAASVGQRLRPAIDHTKRARDNAISAAIANVVLHEHRTDFGAHNRAGGTRFEATGFLAMFANI